MKAVTPQFCATMIDHYTDRMEDTTLPLSIRAAFRKTHKYYTDLYHQLTSVTKNIAICQN